MSYTQNEKNNQIKNIMTFLPEKAKNWNVDPITVAFVLALASQHKNSVTLKQILDENLIKDSSLKYRIEDMLDKNIYKQMQELLSIYTYKDFAYFVCNYNPLDNPFRQNDSTPDCLIQLIIKLFNIKNTDIIGDFGCGKGNFLMKAFLQQPKAHFYGYDINTNSTEIAKMRAILTSPNIEIKQNNIFDIDKKDFNKIFSNYPFALPLRHLGNLEYIKNLQKFCPKVSTATSSDWVFNFSIVDHLAEDGKGIAIMTNGSTWNTIDTSIRKYFIEQGLIEAIIALPNKLFFNTYIATCLIILSKGNKTIRMIDASQMYISERRQNILTEDNINKIVEACTVDSAYSKQVYYKELEEQNYVLFPGKYLKQEIEVKNSVRLEDLAQSITRAAALRADELDTLISNTPTPIQYLSLSDISQGCISKDLHYLKELPGKCQSAIIKDNSLILSKNAPYKSAVIRIKPGQTIVASGNMYIISLDESKANPFYIQAFFESAIGQKILEQSSVGVTVPTLSIKTVKELKIPSCPLAKQKEIAHRYLCAQDEISILKMQLAKAEKHIQNIWEEAQED